MTSSELEDFNRSISIMMEGAARLDDFAMQVAVCRELSERYSKHLLVPLSALYLPPSEGHTFLCWQYVLHGESKIRSCSLDYQPRQKDKRSCCFDRNGEKFLRFDCMQISEKDRFVTNSFFWQGAWVADVPVDNVTCANFNGQILTFNGIYGEVQMRATLT